MNLEYWAVLVPIYLASQKLITDRECASFYKKREQGTFSISSNIVGWAFNVVLGNRIEYVRLAQRY